MIWRVILVWFGVILEWKMNLTEKFWPIQKKFRTSAKKAIFRKFRRYFAEIVNPARTCSVSLSPRAPLNHAQKLPTRAMAILSGLRYWGATHCLILQLVNLWPAFANKIQPASYAPKQPTTFSFLLVSTNLSFISHHWPRWIDSWTGPSCFISQMNEILYGRTKKENMQRERRRVSDGSN